jgi:hypothetical protein
MRKKPRKLGKMKKLLKEKFTTISTSVKVLLVIPSKFWGPSHWPTSLRCTLKPGRYSDQNLLLYYVPLPTYLPTVTKCLTYLLPTYIVTSCNSLWCLLSHFYGVPFAWVFCRVDFLDFVIFESCLPSPLCQNTKWTSYFWNSGKIENSPKKKKKKVSKNQIIFKVLASKKPNNLQYLANFHQWKKWWSHIGILTMSPLLIWPLHYVRRTWAFQLVHGFCIVSGERVEQPTSEKKN